MDNGFRKFKRKQRSSAIFRAVLTGLSVGVLAVAVQWLIAKLSMADPNFVTYGLIGGGLALVTTGILLAILLPTDKRVAKRLDTKLELNEKVQTMIAFREEEGDMIRLQRDDTNQILQTAPGKKLRSKTAWLFAILPVLACVCMVFTIFVQAQEAPPPPDPDQNAWAFRVYDEQKLKDLIEYVRTSNMDMEPKNDVVTELEQLLAKLKTIKKVGLMNEAVVSTIGKVSQIVGDFNTYDLVTGAMKNVSAENIQNLGVAIDGLEIDPISEQIEKMKASFVGQESATVATAMRDGILQALENSGEKPENALYSALNTFAQELGAVTNETAAEEIAAILKRGEAGILAAVEQPRVNVKVEEYVITRLINIFGIPTDKLPEDMQDSFGNDQAGDPNAPDEPKKPALSGGKGDGEFVVGSEDKIFDPELGQWVSYAQVLSKYQGIITGYYGDEMDDDIRKAIEDYLTSLQDSKYNDKNNLEN